MQFELKPFSINNLVLSLAGEFSLNEDMIEVSYEVEGHLDEICWPEKCNSLERATGLWESTCLEFFLGPAGQKDYLEFNISPEGKWNCFSFLDERTGMSESDGLVLRELRSNKGARTASLEARIAAVGLRAQSLQVGISAVIRYKTGVLHYALSHGTKADFHDRRHHPLVHRGDL